MTDEQYQQLSDLLQETISDDDIIQAVCSANSLIWKNEEFCV